MAFTEQDQQDLMYLIVGALDAAPGRTIFNDLAESMITGGATLEDIADSIVAHPLFSDNSIGEYPISQTNGQFANEYAGSLLGARGDLVEGSAWDEAVSVMTSELNGGLSRADLILLATSYLGGSGVAAAYQAAADALGNKVEVALYQAVDLELDIVGDSLDDYRAPLADVDNTQASVDAAKDALFAEANTVNLTTGVDILTGNVFNSVPEYTPGGDDFVNTLQDEDELTGIGNNPTLNVTIGGTGEEGTESEIAPILNGIQTLNVDWTQAGGMYSVSALDLQDATGLTTINVNRITDSSDSSFDLEVENIGAETTNIGVSKATIEADLEFRWREDELTGNETLNLTLDRVRLEDLDLRETGDSSEDQGYFFETINVQVNGTTNLDQFDIDPNSEESGTQTVNFTVDGNLEINDFNAQGVDVINIEANDDVFIGEDEDDVLDSDNDGIWTPTLDNVNITGAGDVTIDGLDSRTIDVDGSAMTGDLTLGTWNLGYSGSMVASGSGDDYILQYDSIYGDVETNGGDDEVGVWGGFGSTSSVSTGDGADSVYGGSMYASTDSQGNGNSTFGEAVAASIDTGAGDDNVWVNALLNGTDWNNGDLLDSNVDDTYLVVGPSVSTGAGADGLWFSRIEEGGVINTGADDDTVSVELNSGNDTESLGFYGVIGEDDSDSREVDSEGDEDFVGAQVMLGSGDDVISFTNSYSGEGTLDFWILGEDAELDGGEGNDTLNVTVTDSVYVTPLEGGEEGDDNGDDFNAYIKGIETANLTILNQTSSNDNDDEDGQVHVDVLRFDSALQTINLESQEAPTETGPFSEDYDAGTATWFDVHNMRDGVELTLSANEATGVDGEGDLADDDNIDVYLDIDHVDADADDDSVTLNVGAPNSSLPGAGNVDLDIDMGWSFSAPGGYAAETDYYVENLTINFEAGGSHFIDLNGFGDEQFDWSDENDGSFMQWRNQDPATNEMLTAYNAIGDKTPFGQGFEVATSLTIANTEAGEEITVVGVTADTISITGDAAVDLEVGEDDEGGSFENNYTIMTGTADDVVDMTRDLVDDEDAINLGDGDNDRLIISGDNSMGFSTTSQPENDEVWHNKVGIEILEIASNDGTNTIVLDEEAFDTGIRQIDVTGTADQDTTIVIGEDFDASNLTVNMGGELGNTALTIISAQDNVLTMGEIYMNADGGASFTLDDDFNLIDINVIITVDTNSATDISATNGGDADGEVEIDVTDGAIETITLVDPGNDASTITIDVADEWSSSVLVIDGSGIANDDAPGNTATGGLNVTQAVAGDDAEMDITGTDNDDNIDLSTSTENDTVSTGLGDDTIDGGGGDDTLDGGDGDDVIIGGDGDDDIAGGDGDNTITGGEGADTMSGGDDDDTYVYNATTESTGLAADTIDGFDTSDDLIDFSAIAFVGGDFVGNFLTTEIAETQLTSTAGETFYITSDQLLWVDVDGSGDVNTGDMVIQMTGLVGTLSDANFAF